MTLTPYAVALAAGAALGAVYQVFGGTAATVVGVIAAFAWAFGPALPGAKSETARIGEDWFRTAMAGFFFAAAAAWALFVMLPTGRPPTTREDFMALRLFTIGGWACVLGGLAWGAFAIRPRRSADGKHNQFAALLHITRAQIALRRMLDDRGSLR